MLTPSKRSGLKFIILKDTNNMRKTLLILTLGLVSVLGWGQSKGDVYASITGVASLGKDYGKSTFDGSTTKYTVPGTTTLAIQGEISYFLLDNWRVALCIGVPYSSSPKGKDSNGKWFYDTSLGFQVSPSISRYFRLTDNFYYTPEIGGIYEFGKMAEEVSAGVGYTRNYKGWGLTACFLAFEFKAGKNISLGVGIGDVSYVNARMSYDIGGTSVVADAGELKFNFNVSQVALKYYFR